MEKSEAARGAVDCLNKKYWNVIYKRLNDGGYKDASELVRDIDGLVEELNIYLNMIKDGDSGIYLNSQSTLMDTLKICRDECPQDGNGIMDAIKGPMTVIESNVDMLQKELKSLYDI